MNPNKKDPVKLIPSHKQIISDLNELYPVLKLQAQKKPEQAEPFIQLCDILIHFPHERQAYNWSKCKRDPKPCKGEHHGKRTCKAHRDHSPIR